jgi:hypothetical protein
MLISNEMQQTSIIDIFMSTEYKFPMNARTTVRLSEDLLRRAKKRALQEGTTLTALLEEGLRKRIGEDKENSGKRSLPPVSSVKGRCLIDLSSNTALADVMDEDLPFEKLR